MHLKNRSFRFITYVNIQQNPLRWVYLTESIILDIVFIVHKIFGSIFLLEVDNADSYEDKYTPTINVDINLDVNVHHCTRICMSCGGLEVYLK